MCLAFREREVRLGWLAVQERPVQLGSLVLWDGLDLGVRLVSLAHLVKLDSQDSKVPQVSADFQVTLDSLVRLVQLEPLDHQVLMVRLDSQEFEVHKAIQDPLERMDHQEVLVSGELQGIQDSQEVLVLLVHQALVVLWVSLD